VAVAGSAAGRNDVGGHVGDVLLGEIASEGRHPAAAVGDLLDGPLEVDRRVVQARPDVAGGAGVGERVAASAAGRGVDLLAGGRVAFHLASSAASASSAAAPAVGGNGALYGLGRGRGLLSAAAARGQGERENGEDERDDTGHRAGSIPTSAAR
jgi:hypothetical protein